MRPHRSTASSQGCRGKASQSRCCAISGRLIIRKGGVRVTLTTFFTAMAKPGGAAHEGCAAQLERIDLLTSGFCGI